MRLAPTFAAAALAASLVPPLAAAPRHPLSEKAEVSFFEALNRDAARRAAAMADLTLAYAIDPKDARTAVLLGLGHLWAAAEGGEKNPDGIPELMLAERFFARAQALDPADDRVPSWIEPARLILAQIEGTPERVPESYGRLMAAYAKRPAFHSFSVGLVNARTAPGSPRFDQAIAALRAGADACADRKDRACVNAPRWPHNSEGFLLFLAEFEARAGNRAAALRRLDQVAAQPESASWLGAPVAAELRAALDKGDPAAVASYRSIFADGRRVGCQACHMGSAGK